MATTSPARPFTAFNFTIEVSVAGGPPLCAASFSECDGLEMSQEVKTIREGGNNGVQIRMAGPVSYGTLTLKRGMTQNFDVWNWFEQSIATPATTAHGLVIVGALDRNTKQVEFELQGCRPLKLKAPPLNAKDGMVAIEELQVAYQSLKLKRPPGGPGA